MRTVSLVQLNFRAAAEAWLETRRPYLAEETLRNYAMYIRTLSAFFAEMRLPEIDGDQVRAYQRSRMPSCGPGNINKECSVLIQMRKRIGIPIQDYQPLRTPKESRGRRLTDAEKKALETAGKYNRELEPCHLAIQIAINSGAGHQELRYIRLKDIDLEGRNLYVQEAGAKNQYRMREVPLNEVAFAAICRAIEIAVERGSRNPDHFLFPRRLKRDWWDPTRPQTSFKKAWARIKEIGGIDKTLRIHDCRHDACSNMLENPSVTPQTAIDILGHVSEKMLKRYGHLSRAAKRAAVDALCKKPAQNAQIPAWLLKKTK